MRPNLKKLQATIDVFNAANPVGTKVRYWTGVRADEELSGIGSTCTAATILSGNLAVVWIDGCSGCVRLSHVEVLRETDVG